MKLRALVGAVAVAMAASTAAFGQNLLDADPGTPESPNPNFNNPSFERPDVASFAPQAEKWTASGPRMDVGFGTPIIAGCGVFENPPPSDPSHLPNMHGPQAAWLFANSFADVETSEVKDHAWTQVTQFTYQAGAQYELAVALANAGSAPPPDSVFTMSLFAVDSAAPGGEILLASRNLQNNGTTALNGEFFVDFSATTAPIAGDAVGKPIGIRFMTHTAPAQPSTSGQFDLDNVRLTIVPEPAGLALLAGAMGLLGTRARCRRR